MDTTFLHFYPPDPDHSIHTQHHFSHSYYPLTSIIYGAIARNEKFIRPYLFVSDKKH